MKQKYPYKKNKRNKETNLIFSGLSEVVPDVRQKKHGLNKVII